PSSIDPWIFLLFWVNWSKPTEANNLRKLINLNLQRQNWTQPRRNNRFNTFRTSSPASNPNQHHILVSNSARPLPSTVNNLRKLEL
ncbi:unnamed protein product, partial [Rotaria magnacalcarata]